MKVLYPHSLRRAKAKVSAKRLLIGLGIVCYLALPSLIHSQISSFRASQILEGLVFALFIGIDEEFFSRGFIYASLEGYGGRNHLFRSLRTLAPREYLLGRPVGLLHTGASPERGFIWVFGRGLDALYAKYLGTDSHAWTY